MNRRVVVTGLGVITGLGFAWRDFWQALLDGRSSIRAWQPKGHDDFPVKFAAPVDIEYFNRCFGDLAELQAPMERRARFGMVAARQALIDAGLGCPESGAKINARFGVAIGSGTPERDLDDMLLAMGPDGPCWEHLYAQRGRLNPRLRADNDHLAASIARAYRCGGPLLNFSTACAGAAHAIGAGMRMIRRGEADCMLAGGADSTLSFYNMLALHLLGAPSVSDAHGDRLCRPFDLERSGLVAGEGAGIVVLESEEHARQRGAQVYAEVCGFGTALDAYRITAPHPDGAGAALAMQHALHDAGLAPESIGYINAHGTSTHLNDIAETRAIKQVFSKQEHYRKLAVSASKSQIGHLITAAGGPEFIATVLALKDGKVPPTLNLDTPDPECDLDYVAHAWRALQLDAALSNSFGFGGLNASLALRRYQDGHR